MTFIKPNKNMCLTNRLLTLVAAALAIGTFAMIGLYNATVNTGHNIETTKAKLDEIGAQITDLNNKLITTLSVDTLNKAAAADGLVGESKPQYFSLSAQGQGSGGSGGKITENR